MRRANSGLAGVTGAYFFFQFDQAEAHAQAYDAAARGRLRGITAALLAPYLGSVSSTAIN